MFLHHTLSSDNVYKRCLFAFPCEIEMTEEQKFLRSLIIFSMIPNRTQLEPLLHYHTTMHSCHSTSILHFSGKMPFHEDCRNCTTYFDAVFLARNISFFIWTDKFVSQNSKKIKYSTYVIRSRLRTIYEYTQTSSYIFTHLLQLFSLERLCSLAPLQHWCLQT